jgi:hypothetical protein
MPLSGSRSRASPGSLPTIEPQLGERELHLIPQLLRDDARS